MAFEEAKDERGERTANPNWITITKSQRAMKKQWKSEGADVPHLPPRPVGFLPPKLAKNHGNIWEIGMGALEGKVVLVTGAGNARRDVAPDSPARGQGGQTIGGGERGGDEGSGPAEAVAQHPRATPAAGGFQLGAANRRPRAVDATVTQALTLRRPCTAVINPAGILRDGNACSTR